MSRQAASLFFGLLLTVIFSKTGFAQDANAVTGNIVDSGASLPGLIAAFMHLGGMLIGVTAIFKTIEHVGNPRDVPMRVPITRYLIGGALFSAPIVAEAVVTTINGGATGIFNPTAETLTVLNGLFAGINAIMSFGLNINGVFENIIDSIDQFPAMISATGYLLGMLVVASAIFKTRDHIEDPTRVPLKDAVIRYLLAGSLFALPTIFEAMYTTIAGNGLGFAGLITSMLSGLNFFFSSETFAVECATAAIPIIFVLLGAGGSLGDVICNTFANTSGFPVFLTAISYLIGLVLGLWGLFKIRDHVVDPMRTGLNEGVMRLIAGGAFFAFPYLTVVLRSTILPTPLAAVGAILTNTGYNETTPTCGGILTFLGLATGPSLDEAMGCFMNDILGPTHVVLNFFCTVAGMIFIMIGISRLIKSAQEGARGPGGMGTIGTFIIGGILLSATTILRAVSSSMFGSPVTTTFASMTYTTGMSIAETQAAHNVISAVLKFMLIIGMISFVRGIFIMRDVAEGKQQASTMAGMTHIIGGALAVNLGPLLNAVQATLGISAFGVSFGL